jgi:hypothetical protein
MFFSISQIPWMPSVLGRSLYFFMVSTLFVAGLLAAYLWIRKIGHIRESAWVLPLIFFGICFFYYLSITTYVYGVYPAIPNNRGGSMPVTEAYFETSDHGSLFAVAKSLEVFSVHGPVYILEQTDSTIYFTSEGMDKWFSRFVTVHALRRDSISYIRFERIDDGFRVFRELPLVLSQHRTQQFNSSAIRGHLRLGA